MTQSEVEHVGLLLKKARESLGLSINDIAVATKINPRILKALEDGQRELLPAKSFARGFIRTYATYLKIDPKPILDGYEESIGADVKKAVATDAPINETVQTSDIKAAPLKKQNSSFSQPSSSSKILLISSILFLVVLIIGIKKVVDKYAHERAVENVVAVLPTASPLPSPAASDANGALAVAPGAPEAGGTNVTEEGGDDDTEAATPKDATVVKDAAAPAVTATPISSPPAALAAPSPSPSAVLKVADIAAKKTDAGPAPKPSATPSPKPSAKPTEVAKAADATTAPTKVYKTQEVIVEALDTVDITIQIDNDPAKTVKLTPESIHTIKAKSQIDLEIADGGMVNLIYNGHERGVPGVLGKPVKIKFP
jgi:cytoskeleton protein RodZ